MEWLVAWGVSELAGFVFKDILLKLAQGALEDYTKDFFKNSLKDLSDRFKKEPLKVAVGKALKEFLQLVQQELETWGCEKIGLKHYEKALEQFIRDDAAKGVLASAFEADCKFIDAKTLETTWNKLNLPVLPTEFDWETLAKQYLRKVKALLRESDELRKIIDSENIEAIRRSTEEIAGIVPGFNLRQYQESIQECYCYLKLDVLHASGYEYKVKLWSMFMPQNVREALLLYDLPKEHQKRLLETHQLEAEISAEEIERQRQLYYRQPIRSVLEIIEDLGYQYIAILGDPGSGKSTLVQYIMLSWVEKPTSIIPLLIELRKYTRDRNTPKDFLDFLHRGSNVICRLNQLQLHEQLESGNAFVMFDGLDEVFDPEIRRTVVTEIIRFTNEYPKVRVLVTSRIIGYVAQPLEDANFCHFTLQDLDSEQVKKFISQWHDLAFGNDSEKFRLIERLQTAIDASPAISELAGNPLLLTMMAILNRNQELPRDRPELYDQASRVLLHNWDIERGLPPSEKLAPDTITRKEKQAMLRQVAYHMQAATKGLAGNLINAEQLEKIIANYLETLKEVDKPRTVARLIIEQLRTRNFILCFYGADCYAFVHRTFLEYFCAWEFIWQFKEKQTLSIEKLKNEVFGKHWHDEYWHEVLRLICGMLDEKFTGQIIEYLIEQNDEEKKFGNIFLAAKCLLEVKNRLNIQATDTKLLNSLKELAECNDYRFGWRAISAIATTWKDDPEVLMWLKNFVRLNGYNFLRSEAVEAIAQGWKNYPETLPYLKTIAQSFDDSGVRNAAVREIVRSWKDEQEILPTLELLYQTDEDEFLRGEVIKGLAEIRKKDLEILSMLKALIRSDEDGMVRSGAVTGLIQGWEDDPETLPILKALINSRDNSFVRSAAIRGILQSWKNEPKTLFTLATLINSNDDWQVQNTAVEGIVRSYKNDSETLSMLKSLVGSDLDYRVRHTAVRELAQGWKNDPGTLPCLKAIVYSKDDRILRSAAVRELAQGWKNDSEILPILKSLIQSGDDEYVRSVAVRELAQGWKNNSEILSILKSLIQSDDDEYVRSAALRELAKGWKNDPEILPMLKNFTKSSDDKYVRSSAICMLAEGWKDDPETLPILKKYAQFDKSWNVRREAVEHLAKGWKNDPETLPILQNCAQFDISWRVRVQVVESLAQGWKDDPETLPVFKHCAQFDDDAGVRVEAVNELGRNWKIEPDVFEILYNCAINDRFDPSHDDRDWIENPRLRALAAIIKQYPQHSQTIKLVRDRAQNDPDEKVRKFAKRVLDYGRDRRIYTPASQLRQKDL